MDRLSTIRLFVPDQLASHVEIDLDASQSHYLVSVMRRRVGDRLLIFNGRDGGWQAEMVAAGRKQVRVMCLAQIAEQTACPDIWLIFVPVKRARLDFIAQKATELGAAKIWPVQSERGQMTRLKDSRLEANIIEAAEQTERLDIPELGPFITLASLLDNFAPDRWLIFCDEAVAGTASVSALNQLATIRGEKAALLIGPEGGFTEAERKKIKSLPKVLPISLGERILRADTAALAALTLWQASCGDWNI